MKICKKCGQTYEPYADENLCEECEMRETPCKICGKTGTLAYVVKNQICVECAIKKRKEERLQKSLLKIRQFYEENTESLNKKEDKKEIIKDDIVNGTILKDENKKQELRFEDVLYRLIPLIIFISAIFIVWFFISGQPWCKDGTNDCIDSVPAQEERDTYAPYDL